MYEVQRAFTYEYVTVSEHVFLDDAQDAVIEILNDDPDATVRIVDTDDSTEKA